MRWLGILRVRARMLFSRKFEQERLDTEIGFHLEQQIAENRAAGMSPAEARNAALRAFGNPAALSEEARDSWNWTSLELTFRNLAITVRTLWRRPGFTLLATLVIALGVGANVSLFTVIRSVLLKPLPFEDPTRLVRLYEFSADDKFPFNGVAGGVFGEWKEQSHSFSDLALLRTNSEYDLSGTDGQLPETVQASFCSWNLFPTLGVQPAIGRGFIPSDDQPSAAATVILSWELWNRRFGGDRAILNKTINLNARPHTVIGVMPQWFAYPDRSVQLWTPVYKELDSDQMRALGAHMFKAIGRLRPGVTEREAVIELSLIVRRLRDGHPDNPFISKAANIRPLLEDMVGDIRRPLYTLFAATACVLLIACLNLANLLVARAAARRRELAVRAALGGGRWRLLSEHFLESLALSGAGGTVGMLLAYGAILWLARARQDFSRAEAIHIDWVVIAFTLGLMVLCGVFTGSISAFSTRNGRIASSIQEWSRSYTGGRARTNLRKALLSLEVGFTVVLLIAAGLLLKSYRQLRSSNLGCITDNVLIMRLRLPNARYPKAAQVVAFYETLVTEVRNLPGVQAAGVVTWAPGQGDPGDNDFAIAEHPPLPVGQGQYASVRFADPGYFTALGIPILRGEVFRPDHRLAGARKVIVNESFARRFFHDEDPLGKHLLTWGKRSFEVIGVVGDTRQSIDQPPDPLMYFPLYSGMVNGATLAVRSRRDVTLLALPIQRLIRQIDRDLAVADILTMDQLIGKSTIDARFDATLLLAFAAMALILAAVGLFGVLSYVVVQRSVEIGIRLALGASSEVVFRQLFLEGLRPAMAGLVFGIGASVATAQLLRSMLYGTQPMDTTVFLSAISLLFAATGLACAFPAYRAARLDAITALRAE